MRYAVSGLLLVSMSLFAQDAIPVGTILAVRLNSSIDSQKSKPGQVITARIMQDVPLPEGRLRAGTQVIGQIVTTRPAPTGASISLQFDNVKISGRSIPVRTNLRALASMMEVQDAQVPSTGTDRGTTFAWMTTNQVGGEVVYGEGGPVTNGSRVVGEAAPGGVLVQLNAKSGTNCRGSIDGNDRPQALWIFASDACGTYGFSDLEIAHAGRRQPIGQITLTSRQGRVHVSAGSGLLLRVNAP